MQSVKQREPISDADKRFIRIGYYRKYKKGMEEDKFESLTDNELIELHANGSRNLTISERLKDSMPSIIFGGIILLLIGYTVVTFVIYNSDYNKITKVEACSLLEGLQLSNVLPEQTVTIEETNNALGAASDCWVRVRAGATEIVAVAYIHYDVAKKYPKSTITTDEWRGIPAEEYAFENNFYRGRVTVYQKFPATTERSTDLIEIQGIIAKETGDYLTADLPKNEDLEGVRRGIVWGWLMPTFFEDEVQGTLPEAP